MELRIGFLLQRVLRHFKEINEQQGITEADRKQLKDFYLQNLIAPEAKKMVEEHLAAEEARRQRLHRYLTPRPPMHDRH